MDTYVVLEIQNTAVLSDVYTDLSDAKAKYHAVLTAAAKSSLNVHSCCIVRCSDCMVIESEINNRQVIIEPVEES